MIDKEQILLLDEQTKFSIDKNPKSTSVIKENFHIYEIGNHNLKNIYVKHLYDEPYSLSKIDKIGYFVKSNIYKNVYYPLNSFAECYEKDLSSLITQIAFNMGAQSVSVISDTKEIKLEENSKNFNISAGMNIKGYGLNKEFENYSYESNNYKKKDSYKYSANIKGKLSLSKEDFSKWIKYKKINLDAVNFMQPYINMFLNNGYLEGELKEEKFSLEYSKHIYERCTKIEAGFNIIPQYLQVSLKFDFNKKETSERKWAKYFKIHIVF